MVRFFCFYFYQNYIEVQSLYIIFLSFIDIDISKERIKNEKVLFKYSINRLTKKFIIFI